MLSISSCIYARTLRVRERKNYDDLTECLGSKDPDLSQTSLAMLWSHFKGKQAADGDSEQPTFAVAALCFLHLRPSPFKISCTMSAGGEGCQSRPVALFLPYPVEELTLAMRIKALKCWRRERNGSRCALHPLKVVCCLEVQWRTLSHHQYWRKSGHPVPAFVHAMVAVYVLES